MKSSKISIVIPTYNKVKYIKETLDSILKQKYSNLEVIIQDGWSTDGTFEILKKYANKHPKISNLESKKDKGQLDAINKGMKKATGEILTFINADDVYLDRALHLIAEAFSKNPGAMWFAGKGKVVDESGREIAKFVTAYKTFLLFLDSRFWLLVTNYLMQPSIFLSRQGWAQYKPFTGTEDFVTEYDMWLKLSDIEMPILINKNLSKFRIESFTKTKQMSAKLLKEDEKIVRKYTENRAILGFHKFHNLGRFLVGKLV